MGLTVLRKGREDLRQELVLRSLQWGGTRCAFVVMLPPGWKKAEPKERGRKKVKTNVKFFPVLIYPDQEGSREERKGREERRRNEKREKEGRMCCAETQRPDVTFQCQ